MYNDTSTTIAATMSRGNQGGGGFSNSGSAAYVAGIEGSPSSSIDKLTYATDSRTTASGTLSIAREAIGGMANSGTAGYFAGGYGGGAFRSTIDKLAFSNDSRSTLSGTLATIRYYVGGMANSGTAGYFGGGTNATGTQVWFSNITKVVFSNDSVSTIGASLASNRQGTSGMANSGTAGYFGGGVNVENDVVSFFNNTTKITFSNDSGSTLGTALHASATIMGGFSANGISGYFVGGSPENRNGRKIAFSNDTGTTLTNILNIQRNTVGVANSGTL